MLVRCPECQAQLKVEDEKLKGEEVKIRCPRCSVIMRVKLSKSIPVSAKPAPKSPLHTGMKSPAAPSVEEEPSEDKKDSASSWDDVLASGAPDDDEFEKIYDKQATIKKVEKGTPARRFKRVPFKEKILIDHAIMVTGIDISEGGLFVHTGRSFIVGSIVDVSLPLTEDEKLVVKAVIQHNHPGVGMGLQFTEMSADQKGRLKKMIRDVDALIPDHGDERKTILLAGGSETARRISKSKLVLEGFSVNEARNTDEVLHILKDDTIDVIVIDWQEKLIDAQGLLAKMCDNPNWKKIIKVVLSGASDDDMQKRVLDDGADVFLAKMDTPPIKLAAKLKEYLNVK